MENSNLTTSRFRGRSEHALDIKGRLNIPSRFRDVLAQYESEELMVTNWGAHLRAFPLSQWEILENKLLTNGREQPGLTNFIRLVVSGVTPCLPDKQGRVLLPPSLRSEAGIVQDVVLAGMLDYVEIWDKDAWELENQATRENFGDYKESLARLGIF
ncbi:MAG: division/cell wall cluster transcriptional repressor MraZ [Deltaproteobacteria bacterium]|nr:division/cell wall cluster transcriptional repressor MraZ [Deltaproteobacteria bacterium]